jgi:hypothetical protein
MLARLGNAFLALSLVCVFSAGMATPAKGTVLTGPIQIGGDDQNDHGSVTTEDLDSDPATAETPVLPPATADGWRYIMLSLKKMLATENRAGVSNSIAVIGTDASAGYLASLTGVIADDGGVSCTTTMTDNTYCMMEVIKAELDGLNGADAAPTITYYETAAEVTAFFDALTAGTTNVAVVYIPGDGGTNDLGYSSAPDDSVDSNILTTTPMEQALMDSSSDIATFNVQGGGLLASGTDNYYSWLQILIPTIEISTTPTTDTIGMTADGAALWVGLKDSDLSTNPWHNHFKGDLGGLKVLGRGFVNDWVDADADGMIDAGEATRLNWSSGPDGIPDNADDLQTNVIIGGAAGEAALAPELPPTNTSGDASASWALLVAALAAVAGLALRVVERKRLQA